MKKLTIGIAALFVAAAAMAQTAPPPAPPRAAKALADYLQLAPDQISAWKQINQDTAAAVRPLAENARDLHAQLQDALNAATPDPAAVGKLALSMHGVQEQIRTLREDAQNKRIALLTPDQRTKFDAFQAAARTIRQPRKPMP